MEILDMYLKLKNRVDLMRENGVLDLDPVCRSIYRQMFKLYLKCSEGDRQAIDFINEGGPERPLYC